MNTQSITITLSEDEALSVRLALNLTASDWADKAMAHDAAGERDDYDTCQRLRAKYHALWERVRVAQRAAEAAALARRVARRDHAQRVAETLRKNAGYLSPYATADADGAAMGIDAREAIGTAIEYLDLAHGDSNPDVNGAIDVLNRIAKTAF